MLEAVLEVHEEEGEKEEMPLFNLIESEYVSKSISTQTDPKLTCDKNHIGCHADIKVEISILFYISSHKFVLTTSCRSRDNFVQPSQQNNKGLFRDEIDLIAFMYFVKSIFLLVPLDIFRHSYLIGEVLLSF